MAIFQKKIKELKAEIKELEKRKVDLEGGIKYYERKTAAKFLEINELDIKYREQRLKQEKWLIDELSNVLHRVRYHFSNPGDFWIW